MSGKNARSMKINIPQPGKIWRNKTKWQFEVLKQPKNGLKSLKTTRTQDFSDILSQICKTPLQRLWWKGADMSLCNQNVAKCHKNKVNRQVLATWWPLCAHTEYWYISKRIKNIILFVLLLAETEKPSYLCNVKRLIDCLG